MEREPNAVASTSRAALDDLESYISMNSQAGDSASANSCSLEEEILTYKKQPRISPNESVLKFWEQKKALLPKLYEVVQTLFGMAITEVNVERLFSNVKFILNPLRTRLSAANLQNILFIRVNFDLIKSSKI